MEGFLARIRQPGDQPAPAVRRLTPSSLQIGYHFAKQHPQIAEIAIMAGCGGFPA
jgi:hypothetical protein